MCYKVLMNNFQRLIYTLQHGSVRNLTIIYTALILVYIYLPEPIQILRYVLNPIITVLLGWITGLVLLNLKRDWR